MGASAPIIRRDSARLEEGCLLRTHGGATLVEPLLYEPFRHDTSFQARELKSAEAKWRISLAAAELIIDYEFDQHRDGAMQSAGDQDGVDVRDAGVGLDVCAGGSRR